MTEKILKTAIKIVLWGILAMAVSGVVWSQEDSGETATPPALEKGWNVISVPCTVRVGGLNRSVLRQLSYFTWDGEKYVRTSVLERGRGYIVDANQVINTSSICENGRMSDPMEIVLKKGWNLVGNPYHEAVPVADVLGDSAYAVFEYRGNRFVQLGEGDKMKPWRGYWVYADREGKMILPETCGVQLLAFGPGGTQNSEWQLNMGELLTLRAGYVCVSNGKQSSLDITDMAQYTLNGDNVGPLKNGRLTAKTPGRVSITVTYEGYESLPIEVTVLQTMEQQCGELLLAVEAGEFVSAGDATGFYSYMKRDNSSLSKGKACMLCGGEMSCGAMPLQESKVYRQEVGREIEIRAYCTGGADLIEDFKDVTDEVAWDLGDTGAVMRKEGNTFLASKDGDSTINAYFHNLKSESVKIEVRSLALESVTIEPGEGWVSCAENDFDGLCSDSDYLLEVSHGYYPFKVIGSFVTDTGAAEFQICEGEVPEEPQSFDIDVSGSASLVSSNYTAAEFGLGPSVTGLSDGTAEITATVMSVKSEPVKLSVIGVWPEKCGRMDVVTMPMSPVLWDDREFIGYFGYTSGDFQGELPAEVQCTGCSEENYTCRNTDSGHRFGFKWYESGTVFTARAFCVPEGEDADPVEVTGSIKWKTGENSVVKSSGENKFYGSEPGQGGLTAVFGKIESVPHLVEIGEPEVEKVNIETTGVISSCADAANAQFCGGADYLMYPGGEIRFTTEVKFKLQGDSSTLMTCKGDPYGGTGTLSRTDPPGLEWIVEGTAVSGSGGVFGSTDTTGFATVTASMGGVNSKQVRVRVIAPDTTLLLETVPGDTLTMSTGGTSYVRARYLKHGESYKYVTEKAQWEIVPVEGEDVDLTVSSGTLTAGEKTGSAGVRFTYNGITSDVLEVVVKEYEYQCADIYIVQKPVGSDLFVDENAKGFINSYIYTKDMDLSDTNYCTGCEDDFSCRKPAQGKGWAAFLDKGTQFELRAVCRDDNRGKDFDITEAVGWEISNDVVIEHNGQGEFTAVGEGTAMVTADFKGNKSLGLLVRAGSTMYSNFLIKHKPAYSCSGLPICTATYGVVGEETQLFAKADIHPDYNPGEYSVCEGGVSIYQGIARRNQDVTEIASWVVLDPDRGEMTGKGKVRFSKAGSAVIKAALGENYDQHKMTVVSESYFPFIYVDPYYSSILVGRKQSFKAYAYYSGKYEIVTGKVDWSYSIRAGNPEPEMDGNVLIAGDKPGRVYVTATYDDFRNYNKPYVYIYEESEVTPARMDLRLSFTESPNAQYVIVKPGQYIPVKAVARYIGGPECTENGKGSNCIWKTENVSDSIDWGKAATFLEYEYSEEYGHRYKAPQKYAGHSFRVSYDGEQSDPLYVYIYDDTHPVRMSIAQKEFALSAGSSTSITVNGFFFNENKFYSNYNGGYDLRKEDITDKAKYAFRNSNYIYKENVSVVEDGMLTAGSSDFSGIVIASYGGVSCFSNLYIRKGEFMMLRTYMPGTPSLDENCPANSCYYTTIMREESLQLKAFEEANLAMREYLLADGNVEWEVSDPSVAMVRDGKLVTRKGGTVWVRGLHGEARSEKVWVVVLTNSLKQQLLIGRSLTGDNSYKPDKPLKAGDSTEFNSVLLTANFVNGTTSTGLNYTLDTAVVTGGAEWTSSNIAASEFQSAIKGKLTGVSPGMSEITATYHGLTSNAVEVETWNFSDMSFCDLTAHNYASWEDENTKAEIETDCGTYFSGEDVNIRYTANVEGDLLMYLDNCLDLYIIDDDGNKVRTLREEGCTTAPVGRTSARTMIPVYQNAMTWDMKDDAGNTLPPGKYHATARFYIIWEPVVSVPITILSADDITN